MKLLTICFCLGYCSISYAQEAPSNKLEKIDFDTPKSIKKVEVITKARPIKEFKADLLSLLDLLYELKIYSDSDFHNLYHGKDYDGRAFDPIIKRIDRTVSNLNDIVLLINFKYQTVENIQNEAFKSISEIFSKFRGQWQNRVNKTCNSKRECTKVKKELSSMHGRIKIAVNIVENLLKS